MKLTDKQIKDIEELFDMKYTDIGNSNGIFIGNINEYHTYYGLSILYDNSIYYYMCNRCHEKFPIPMNIDKIKQLIKILENKND